MPKDKNQEVPQKILDKGGVKTINVPNKDAEILVPKEIEDSQEKFIKTYAKIKDIGGLNKETDANEFVNLFNYYIISVLETQVSARMDRYDQMDFIIENDGSLSLARKVLKDEIMQADVFDDPITVTSKNPKFKKAVVKLIKDLGVKDLIPETGKNLISYGDAFWVLDIENKLGVQKIIPLDSRDVRHRFEFSIADLRKHKNKLVRKYTGLQAIIDLGASVNSSAKHFNRVLLGFQVIDTIFPFWQVLHFRQFTTRKTIFPFGMPTFYESQSEARMYLNAKVVISMIRSSAFMREHVKVKTAEDEGPAEQWTKVQEVKQMMELLISRGGKTSKDIPSFGEKYYYPEGLLEIDKVEAGFNFRDRFEDLQIMREDVFTSTGLPKGYFVGEGGTYVPIKALMQQDKKTARMVFELQRIIISQIIKLIETHFSFIDGEFDPYEEEFAISLPYPIPDIEDTMIGISQAKMNYATTTIDSLKQSLGITKIPEPIIKKLLITYFPITDDEINIIIKQMRQDSDDAEDSGVDPQGAKYGDPFMTQKAQVDMMSQEPEATEIPGGHATTELPPKKPNKQENYFKQFMEAIAKKPLSKSIEEVIDEQIMSRNKDEFVFMGRHYMSNKYVSQDRNTSGVINLNESKALKTAKQVKVQENNEDIKLKGIDIMEDAFVDNRYLTKEEKKKGIKNVLPYKKMGIL